MNSLFALLDAVSGTVAVCESLAEAEKLALEWKAEMLDLARDSYTELMDRYESASMDMDFLDYLDGNKVKDGDLQIFFIKTGNRGYQLAKSLLDGGYDATGKLNNFLTERVESVYLTNNIYTLCHGNGEFRGEPTEQAAIDAGMADDYDVVSSFTTQNSALNALADKSSSYSRLGYRSRSFKCCIYWVQSIDVDGNIEIVDVAKFRD